MCRVEVGFSGIEKKVNIKLVSVGIKVKDVLSIICICAWVWGGVGICSVTSVLFSLHRLIQYLME